MLIYRLCVLFCLGALLAGCGAKPVVVIEKEQFAQMARRMPKELQVRRLLNSDNAYTPALSLAGFRNYGDTLFHRLSPSFMFGDSGHVYLGDTFAATLQPESRVKHRPNGFSINHPTQKLDLNMVAIVDWNSDGETEWLISCLVEPKTGGGRRRNYYVLVPPPRNDTEQLKGTAAAVYECFGLACNLYVRDSRIISRTADDTLIAPTEVQDFMPGLQPVTTPPSGTPGKKQSAMEERSL
ncbi:hypothetical protein AGMMS49974_04930 [Deltaproteobacteria bacterium]|nr:hypothetical protein AGMMS49974_04930 [Deltaproteobacteria bacterium]